MITARARSLFSLMAGMYSLTYPPYVFDQCLSLSGSTKPASSLPATMFALQTSKNGSSSYYPRVNLATLFSQPRRVSWIMRRRGENMLPERLLASSTRAIAR